MYTNKSVYGAIGFMGATVLMGTVTSATLLATTSPTQAFTLTNSVDNFSLTQGNTNGTWQYGFWNKQEDFVLFPTDPVSGQWEQPSYGAFSDTGGTFSNPDPERMVRRWISDFEGTIRITSNVSVEKVTSEEGTFRSRILANGTKIWGDEIPANVTGTAYETQQTIDVKVGDSIDFLFAARNGWTGEYSFNSIIDSAASSTSFLTFLTSNEGIVTTQTITSIDPSYPTIIEEAFSSTVKGNLTLPSAIRTSPDRNNGTTIEWLPAGTATPLAFDAWTRSDFVDEVSDGLGGTDLWYRLSNSTNWPGNWISGNLIVGQPTDLNPVQVDLNDILYNIDHVGLISESFGDKVYEAFRGYTDNPFWDILEGDEHLVAFDPGVQSWHSQGSFIHRSSDANTSPVSSYRYVPIPDDEAAKLIDFINAVEDKDYLDMTSPTKPPCTIVPLENILNFPYNDCLVQSEQQKGQDGLFLFSNVGLIEAAAEDSGITNQFLNLTSGGYIPDFLEDIDFTLNNQDYKVSFLTPALLEASVQGDIQPSELWIKGWLESVDFLLTDPNGQTLGYQGGFAFNTIPDSWFVINQYPSDAPAVPNLDACATVANPVENRFQFYVPRIDGEYTLELFGLNQNSKAVVETEEGGKLIYPNCDPENSEEIVIGTEKVPEPSLIWGLSVFSIFSFGLLKKRKST